MDEIKYIPMELAYQVSLRQEISEEIENIKDTQVLEKLRDIFKGKRENKGKWIVDNPDILLPTHKCSKCNEKAIRVPAGIVYKDILTNYCPNCGIKMEK